ncbi:MAG TPA: sugar-binding protein, partial [Opitutus sp.]|nr:sugar-binding protein [Opitutus sp.]
GKPIILSEWHFASPNEGLSSSKGVRDQRERGLAYRNYVEQAAALPFVVGSEWFIYTDQALTGRYFEGFNGEGNNTGLVNVADRPYRELVTAAAETHARIYPVMFGQQRPFSFDDPRFVPHSGGGLKEVTVPRAPVGFTLDGTTRAWPQRPAEPIEPARLSHGLPNEKLRADFRLCWDDAKLYLHVQVKDATPMLNHRRPRAFWMGDCVEIYLGTEKLEQGGTPLFSDRHILLAASRGQAFFIDEPEFGDRCTVIASKEVSGDGYVVQLAIPWELLGGAPSAGKVLLFDLGVDNSDDGYERRQQLMWNGNAKNFGDRALWGRARLISN